MPDERLSCTILKPSLPAGSSRAETFQTLTPGLSHVEGLSHVMMRATRREGPPTARISFHVPALIPHPALGPCEALDRKDSRMDGAQLRWTRHPLD